MVLDPYNILACFLVQSHFLNAIHIGETEGAFGWITINIITESITPDTLREGHPITKGSTSLLQKMEMYLSKYYGPF